LRFELWGNAEAGFLRANAFCKSNEMKADNIVPVKPAR
jgi:hypothetical protein